MRQIDLRQDKRVRITGIGALTVLTLMVLVLLVRGCGEPSPPRETLLVPEDLAAHFDLDRDGILDYARLEIAPADYEGVFRGAHGALWAGEANAWDRLLLAAAALEAEGIETRIVPDDPPRLAYRDRDWVTLRLDTDDPDGVSSSDPPEGGVPPGELEQLRPDLFHRIAPAFLLEDERGQAERINGPEQNLFEWGYQPVIVEVIDEGNAIEYLLRVGQEEVLASGDLNGVHRVALELSWRFQDREHTWTRELFDRTNAAPEIPGRDQPRDGDRYALVVTIGPLIPEVLETRLRMLELERYTPLEDPLEQDLVVLGTRYLVDSDMYTRQLEEEIDATASWETPRIMIAGSEIPAEPVPDLDAGEHGLDPSRMHSLDALADQVEAYGEGAYTFQTARGMANDQIETNVLFEATGIPVVSASAILSIYSAPNAANAASPERRILGVEQEARRLLTDELIGTRVTLTAELPPELESPSTDDGTPAPEPNQPPSLVLERTEEGLRLHGLRDLGTEDDRLWERFQWDESNSVLIGYDPTSAAVVADVMFAHQLDTLNYSLRFDVARALEHPPLTSGSVVNYRVLHKGEEYRLSALVSIEDGLPRGFWNLRPGEGWIEVWQGSDARIGEIVGAWPDVISITPLGPRLEAYVAPADTVVEGDRREFSVWVGGQEQTVEGVRVTIPPADAPFIEAEQDGRWYPAILVREDGLLQTKSEPLYEGVGGRVEEVVDGYRVHYIGQNDSDEDVLPASRIRHIEPMEMQVDDEWHWVHALEQRDGQYLVRYPGAEDRASEWVEEDRLRPIELAEAQVDGEWHAVAVLDERDDEFLVRVLDGETGEEAWLGADHINLLARTEQPKAEAILLPGPGGPLVLAWRQGETGMLLDFVTPAVRGQIVDDGNGFSIAGGTVGLKGAGRGIIELGDAWSAQAAADGSFLMPVVDNQIVWGNEPPDGWDDPGHPAMREAAEHHLILVVAGSETMGETVGEAKRIDLARQWIERLFDALPIVSDDISMSLMSYPVPDELPWWTIGQPDFIWQVGHQRGHPDLIFDDLASLALEGESSLSAAVRGLAEEVQIDADTTIVLLSNGEDVDVEQSAVDAYRESNLSVPIHTVGLWVEPGSVNEIRLQQLSEVSGGHYWRVNSREDVEAWFQALEGERAEQVRLQIHAPGYVGQTIEIPARDVGMEVLQIPIRMHPLTDRPSDRAIEDGERTLLRIGEANLGDLEWAEGLSPKARRMIEDRVRGGEWEVIIPAHRTNIGPITAYGWFEFELETGRLVGRTEDGLHGSSVALFGNWPPFDPAEMVRDLRSHAPAQYQPFLEWFEGITAYTTGSVMAAFDWSTSPGFPGDDPDDFGRFVQANALDFVVNSWGGTRTKHFWAGVCGNFAMQSAALGLPATDCHRLWFEDTCDRYADKLREELGIPDLKEIADVLGEALDQLADEVDELLRQLRQAGVDVDSSAADLLRDIAEALRDKAAQAEGFWDEVKALACSGFSEQLFGPDER